jgi:isoquinoline 1-oxidoreductase alpha subunit
MPNLRVNGRRRSFHGDRETPLLWVLRDELGLTGTKYGCGTGACGACMVLVDGKPARSCIVPVGHAIRAAITTIEGARGREAAAVIAAWQALDVVQCGYCQSGQIMSAIALLSTVRDPSDADIDAAMAGNLCRCCTYARIRAAIHRAAGALRA